MNPSNDKKQQTFEKDYYKIMKDFQFQNTPLTQPSHQWTNPNDFIVKFSLYQETPNSITSTDTLVNSLI